MKVTAYKLSSFAKGANGGNPAGVVLDADALTEDQMQRLAKLVGYSETAFVSKSDVGDFNVRFFTPNAEVDLCGHATIATYSLMKQKGLIKKGSYTQETKAGLLRIIINEESIFMEQAQPEFYEIIPYIELEDCLGMKQGDFNLKLPIQIVSTGVRDIFVPVRDRSVLEVLKPNMKKIEEISIKYNVTGLHVFALSEPPYIATCRNFAPLFGIPEESATGTSNGALSCYLYNYGCIGDCTDDITIEQGSYMDKPSIIKAKLEISNKEIKAVWVGGDALIIGEEDYQI